MARLPTTQELTKEQTEAVERFVLSLVGHPVVGLRFLTVVSLDETEEPGEDRVRTLHLRGWRKDAHRA